MIEITGSETTAYIKGLSENELEDSARDQIQSIVNHPAFRNDIVVMPDVHVGAGAMIGFTMQLEDRIIPNVIGVDIGCGMYAFKLNSVPTVNGDVDHEHIETKVRDRIPMGWGKEGYNAPNREYYHVKNEFPWDEVNKNLQSFINSTDGEYVEIMEQFVNEGGYDIEYFTELATERAGEMSTYFDERTAINSLGTLGSGNHFIEIAESKETGEYWVVIHSGSRGLGENTAKYHQQRAIELRDDRADIARDELRELIREYDPDFIRFDVDAVSDTELLNWLQGGMGEDFIDKECIRESFSPDEREKIGVVISDFNSVIPSSETSDLDSSLDWLEGEEAAQYLIDMIFCQMYAKENRRMMGRVLVDALETSMVEKVHSVHNYIDFRDQVIRKGATRAYNGEKQVIPFNMRDGSVLVKGKGNSEWNNSVSHGAGRAMSSRSAMEKTSEEELRAELSSNDVFIGEAPPSESPIAYKDASLIENAISETATVVDKLKPVHNFKGND